MNAKYPAVAERAAHRCEYCRAPEAIFNLPFEVEHIVPQSQTGTDAEDNLALSCRACNLFKADHVLGFDIETGEEAPLFHPRQDAWDQHFRIDRATAVIEGISAIGKATVERLQMNRRIQIAARQQWMQLGLFP